LAETEGATLARPDAPAGITAAFHHQALESRMAGEPDWLSQRRLSAWGIYEQLPLPSRRLEEWRYTDPRLLKWDAVTLSSPVAGRIESSAARAFFAGKPSSARVLQVNGGIAAIEVDPDVLGRGVIVKTLPEAALDHESLVREHLGAHARPADGKFIALNSAFWSAGVFIHVPRGVRLDRPIRMVRWIDAAGAAFFPRTLVLAGEGSSFGIVEELASPDFDSPVFCCGVCEVHASSAADVQYVAMQQWGRGVRHLGVQRTVAKRDANLDTLVVNLGGTVARSEVNASLEGPGARSDMLGLYFAHGDQHFDHETRQDHRVAHASSDLLYKGALDGKSRAIFRGLIKVWPGAQRTDAYQTSRNLILSKQAEATSLPNLEIEADDVRCSHAATVGHLDQEELFYIMSRGIPRREAERLVVFGFYGDVLARLPMPGVVRELRDAIEARIG